ncbi:MAG: 23S rRNA (uracil(1939)-C(5))-methyltransferase RlmD, partial [Oscillospiraceae bacterium]|nr:23S rRNA (uracil(1939)-C(5))-methyltransferase RlmD [Oscillospiraceae bacterium]
MLRKSAVYEAEITDYTADGMGVAHVEGCAVFIPNAVAGERLRISVVHAGRNKAIGRIEEILERSPHRIVRDCPWAKVCGGCDFRHMDYEEELRLKAQRVRDALTRLGGWDPGPLPIAGAKALNGYRNKAIFPVAEVKGRAEAGFYRARTHSLIPIDRCLLQNDAANAARSAVVDWMRKYRVAPYDEETGTGLVRHIFVRSGGVTGQVMVCLIVNGGKLPRENELCKLLREAVPGLASVLLCANTRPGNAILGEAFRTLWGEDAIEDELCGLRFRLSPRSFYQVNRDQAEVLYEKAAAFAGLTKTDTVLDLYCGTGTITLHLARQAGQAVGVELVDAAIADAKRNAERNGIENARFFCAD